LRHLGINAARLVKGQPLVFASDGASLAGVDDSLRNPQDESEELINQILDQILKGYADLSNDDGAIRKCQSGEL
jgi:hypothetical protein